MPTFVLSVSLNENDGFYLIIVGNSLSVNRKVGMNLKLKSIWNFCISNVYVCVKSNFHSMIWEFHFQFIHFVIGLNWLLWELQFRFTNTIAKFTLFVCWSTYYFYTENRKSNATQIKMLILFWIFNGLVSWSLWPPTMSNVNKFD